MSDESTASPPQPPPRRLWPATVGLTLAAMIAALFHPASFSFLAGLALHGVAMWHGAELDFRTVEGSIIEPLRLRNVVVSATTRGGARIQAELAQVDISFMPSILPRDRDRPFLRELTAARGRMSLSFVEAEGEDGEAGADEGRWARFVPERMAFHHVDLEARAFGRMAEVEAIHLTADTMSQGDFSAAGGWLRSGAETHVFGGMTGKTSLGNGWLSLLLVDLGPEVKSENLSIDLRSLIGGRIDASFSLAAFDGEIRGELNTRIDRRRSKIEASGYFYNISVAGLAGAISPQTDAGGTIKEGRFSFFGEPHQPDRGAASLRFEATDFRWGGREWNSLVVGCTLIDRRLKLAEFSLRQSDNLLALTGEMTLPSGDRRWWESDFAFDMSAAINDLAALGALLGPEIEPLAGHVNAKGSVRGQARSYEGQILVTGTKIDYGEIPIDSLHAAIQLEGNKLDLSRFELLSGGDHVRGRGVINILGERRYWAEMNAAIHDLKAYAALPAPAAVPWPMEGSLQLTWSGDGTAGAHSGAISAQVEDFLPTASADRLPLTGKATATYSPENIFFTEFVLSQGDARLSMQINAAPYETHFSKISLRRGNKETLSGDATLPAGFRQLGRPEPTHLPSNRVALDLRADGLQIADIASVAGLRNDVRATLTGTLKADASLDDFRGEGALEVRDGVVPESYDFPLRNGRIEARILGSIAQVEAISADAFGGRITGAGEVNLRHLRDPNLRLRMRGDSLAIEFSEKMAAGGDVECTLNGLLSAAYVDAFVHLDSAKATLPFHPEDLLDPSIDLDAAAPAFNLPAPFHNWRLNMAIDSTKPLRLSDGLTLTPDLRLSGRAASPALEGKIAFRHENPSQSLDIEGTLFFLDRWHVALHSRDAAKKRTLVVGSLDKRVAVVPDGAFEPGLELRPDSSRLTLENEFSLHLVSQPAVLPILQ